MFQLTVIERPKIRFLNIVEVELGESFTVVCEIGADTSVDFLYHGTLLSEGSDSSVSFIPGSNQFAVDSAHLGHSGLVTCIARNSAGVSTKITTITVLIARK